MRWLLLLAFLFGIFSPAYAAPHFVAETYEYDFGEIAQGDVVEQTFRFRNAGDQLLQLTDLRSSCGCTAAFLSTSRLLPGEIGELGVRFESANFEGSVTKAVYLNTNDPTTPQVSFTLQGHVRPELLVKPKMINFKLPAGKALHAKITIVNYSSETITLQEPKITNPVIRATLNSLELAPGGQAELEISADFAEGQKRLSGYVMIATDFSRVPELRIPVSVRLAK